MKNLRFMCAQPRLIYYAWQVEVMLNNFIKHGIDPNNIDILVGYNQDDNTSSSEAIEMWNKLVSHHNKVRFFFYEDTRLKPTNYIPSIRPNIIKQHFKKYPELKDEAIFYHDCDILFTKKPNFDKYLSDNIWYLSDTTSYTSYDYIISKGEDIYDKMCEIVHIPKLIPKLMAEHSGGAQYLLKNVNWTYWDKVERDCESLYRNINYLSFKKKIEDINYGELQTWHTDIWSVLWNSWLIGHKTKVVKELDFCCATDPLKRWNEVGIYHNVGVTCSCGESFYKADYKERLPYKLNLRIKEANCSYLYYQEIKEVELKSCLI
jgi:hypothetical protein